MKEGQPPKRLQSLLSAQDPYDLSTQQTTCNQDEYETPHVSTWSSGFQYTTFVRLSIQFACYEKNPDTRWQLGYRYLRKNGPNCATSECHGNGDASHELIKECTLRSGKKVNLMTHFDGYNTELARTGGIPIVVPTYSFVKASQIGTFDLLGGFQVYLGLNSTTANKVLQQLSNDNVFFDGNIASLVVDYVTYNGNLDTYVYNNVKFSQESTGRMSVDTQTTPVPFNFIYKGNYYSMTRITAVVFGIIYAILVFYFLTDETGQILQTRRDTFAEYWAARDEAEAEGDELKKAALQSEKPHALQFLFNYYAKGPFQALGSLATASSLATLSQLLFFMVNAFRMDFLINGGPLTDRYEIPTSDLKEHGINDLDEDNPLRYVKEDAYIFAQFEDLSSLWRSIRTVSSINLMLLILKVVKFILDWRVFNVIASTFRKASSLILIFTLILGLQLVGYALLYHVLFGVFIRELKTPIDSLITLFGFLLGDFEAVLLQMQEKGQLITFITFILFMLFFNFVLFNMYLATMMSTYSDSAAADQIKRARELVRSVRKDREKKKLAEQKLEQEIQQYREATDQSDVQSKLVVIETMRCCANIMNFCSKTGDGGGGNSMFAEDKASRPTIHFWRSNGGLGEVVRDVENACSQFMYTADLRMCLPEGRNYISLAPGESNEWKKTRDMLKTLEKSRSDPDGNPDLEIELEEHHRQTFYYKSLYNTLSDILCTQKGSATMCNDESFAKRAFTESDFRDTKEIQNYLESQLVFGEEMWLDLLITALEDEDSDFVNTLFCKDASLNLKLPKTEKIGDRMLSKLREPLYRGAERVLQLFELKANTAYYSRLNEECKLLQDLYHEQNLVLHEYSQCLERHIAKSLAQIKFMEQRKLKLVAQFESFM